MAVLKLKAIAIILAFCAASVAATGGETATCLSDHTITETAVTDAGYSISDGTLVSTMNICTVTHETKCDHVASVPYSVEMHPSSAAGMPSAPTGATAPADSSATSVGAQGVSATTEAGPPAEQTGAQSTGAPVVPVVPAPPSSGPSYVPGPGTASGEQGTNPSPTNSAGVEKPSPSAVVSATDVPGVQTTTAAYGSSVTDTAVVVTDSETGYETAISSTATDTYPSSAEETDESTPTGTPGVTASAAAKMLAPGAALSIAGMLIAVIF
ncbi:hypothetical protein NW756_007296 [Fusarium oxysporum]|nr:hypothetical protein NW753_001478 [Fusarium oxysporum]KAJ4071913.1 hypothetical protein NW763_000937 [Fusarium oxysporum]KAJ4088897.1 hypothetical protein NW756_007296 [Fusarium oxysporum]KAJ4116567.1 hypothetical protein NW769_003636 [Fusarium oxysporum]KAJ4225217.1 hypothetical protein NW760_009681 [Fusarium oxysporum]